MPKSPDIAVVVNPISGNAASVERDLLTPLKEAGHSLDIIDTQTPVYEPNVDRIAGKLGDTDASVVIAATGDGGGSQSFNGIVDSGRQDMSLAFYPGGGLCDFATAFNGPEGCDPLKLVDANTPRHQLTPLEILANGKRVRLAPGYMTAGWTAEAVRSFDDRSVLRHLEEFRFARKAQLATGLGRAGLKFIRRLPTGNQLYLPPFTIDDQEYDTITDVAALNISHMARVVKNPGWNTLPTTFHAELVNARNLAQLGRFALRATGAGLSTEQLGELRLHFVETSDIGIQTEGEYKGLYGIDDLTVRKRPDSAVPVVMPRAA